MCFSLLVQLVLFLPEQDDACAGKNCCYAKANEGDGAGGRSGRIGLVGNRCLGYRCIGYRLVGYYGCFAYCYKAVIYEPGQLFGEGLAYGHIAEFCYFGLKRYYGTNFCIFCDAEGDGVDDAVSAQCGHRACNTECDIAFGGGGVEDYEITIIHCCGENFAALDVNEGKYAGVEVETDLYVVYFEFAINGQADGYFFAGHTVYLIHGEDDVVFAGTGNLGYGNFGNRLIGYGLVGYGLVGYRLVGYRFVGYDGGGRLNGGIAAGDYFNSVDVDGEHVGYVIVTECDIDGQTCIVTEINGVLYIFAGADEVKEFME